MADYENDAISTRTKTDGKWAKIAELDLRPGKENSSFAGTPGGSYPFWVQIRGNDTAYISSIRDRQIVVVKNSAVVGRIPVPGQPNKWC